MVFPVLFYTFRFLIIITHIHIHIHILQLSFSLQFTQNPKYKHTQWEVYAISSLRVIVLRANNDFTMQNVFCCFVFTVCVMKYDTTMESGLTRIFWNGNECTHTHSHILVRIHTKWLLCNDTKLWLYSAKDNKLTQKDFYLSFDDSTANNATVGVIDSFNPKVNAPVTIRVFKRIMVEQSNRICDWLFHQKNMNKGNSWKVFVCAPTSRWKCVWRKWVDRSSSTRQTHFSVFECIHIDVMDGWLTFGHIWDV